MTFFEDIADVFLPSNNNNTGGIIDQAKNTATPGTQLVVSLVLGIISLFIFSISRIKWPALYCPKSRLIKNPPPALNKGLFGWFKPLHDVSEAKLLELVGLDALMFIRFFKMSSIIFGICALYGCLVLIPLTATNPTERDDEKDKGYDINFRWSIQALGDGSPKLVAHCVGVYIFSFLMYFFLNREYQMFSSLRWTFLLKARKSFTARSIMVEGIPTRFKNDASLKEHFQGLDIGDVEEARVCHSTRSLTSLVQSRASSLRKVETELVNWLGNPCLSESYDPELVRSTLRAETILEIEDKKRPTIRTGFLGLVGSKVDAINFYFNRFKSYDIGVKHLRAKDKKYRTTTTGFVTFRSIRSAHMATQLTQSDTPFTLRTRLAPEPRDIYWMNLNITARERLIRDVIVQFAMLFVVFFWAIPLSLISPLLSLDELVKTFKFLKDLEDLSPYVWSLLSGFLPTVTTITFIALTPFIFTGLSIIEGNKSHSSIERHAVSKHFFFLIFNILLVFTIATSVWKTLLNNIIEKPTEIPAILATALPAAAPFFVNYVMILGIGYFPLQLLQLGPLFYFLFRRVFCKTPRDFADLLAPVFTDYAWLYGQPMIVFVICTTYAVVSPLILLVGAVYFLVGHYVSKYCLLYVYFRNYESGGLYWPLVFRRIIVGLFILQVLMAGYFSLKSMYPLTIAMVPLLILTSIFLFYISKAYPHDCKYLPATLLQGDAAIMEPLISQEVSDEYSDNIMVDELTEEPDNDADADASPSIAPRHRSEYFFGPTSHDGNAPDINPVTLAFSESMDVQQFTAEPDLRSNYEQSPMFKYYGILDSGITHYGNPAIHGALPMLWMPQKVSQGRYRKLYKNRTCFCCFPTTLRTDSEDNFMQFEQAISQQRNINVDTGALNANFAEPTESNLNINLSDDSNGEIDKSIRSFTPLASTNN